MGKGSDAPDVSGAAEIEGEYSRETARDVTYADRPDQYNPFGSIQWGTEQVRDPATGEMVTKWTQNQNLNPALQGALDSTMGMMGDRAALSSGMMGRIQDEMGGAPDWEQFGDVVGFDPTQQRQHAEDSAYAKAVSRLDPRFSKQANDLEIKLRNMGLRPGDQAYDAQMSNFSNSRNDAYEQALWGSVAQGRDEFGVALQGNERANALRNQQIQEYLGQRGFSLGEANALQEGQTIQDMANMVSGGG